MTPQLRRQQVQDLFDEVVELDDDERVARLAECREDDPALWREVTSLLAAYGRAGDVLSRFEPVGNSAPDGLEGRFIGRYRIVREIGRGGMGTVYLAQRVDGQFDRRVALKLVKRGMDTDEVLRRFRYERQILGALEHSHIARLYDAGVSDDGRPYLVMEYIDGKRIDDYCDAKKLNVDARLALFATICEAVRYAHQNLVVHRDLKPSNILVTDPVSEEETMGGVKLLDFGIAKLLSAADNDMSQPATRVGFRMLTPEYAAPEQISGEAITTATDVYALGIVLYQLLTGRRPFETARPGRPEAEDATSRTDIRPPSTVVHTETEVRLDGGDAITLTPEQISIQRGTSPDRLRKRLRGDLDTILLKALQREPERRYPSAEAFLDDIRRHLEGLPVRARPDTLGYRARSFARRHRVAMVAAALVLLSLAGGLSAALWQAEKARQERDVAREVSGFLEGLFQASDPYASGAERLDTLRVRDLLVRGESQVRRDLRNQPAVQAHMLDVLGTVNHHLGRHQEARSLLEQAVALRRELYGPLHTSVVESQNHLAAALIVQGHYEEAGALLNETLHIGRRIHGREHPEVENTLRHLIVLYEATANYDEAEHILRDLLTIHRRRHGSAHPDLATTLNNLALVLRSREAYADAEPLAREAVALHRELYDNEHPKLATSLEVLGSILRNLGDLNGAEQVYRESMQMKRNLLDDEHPDVGFAMTHLAELLRDKGDYAASITLYRDVLDLARRTGGSDHPGVAIITSLLANVYHDDGDHLAADTTYREALMLLHRALPNGHVRIGRTTVNLGHCLKARGEFQDAEVALVEGERLLRENNHNSRRAVSGLIALYDAWDKPQDAARWRRLLDEDEAAASLLSLD